jgi:mannose-6-phosphate isomerase-like protein (cupin superfamily)
VALVEEPAENDEDQQIVEAVLKGLQKIAEDTVAMATNVNEGRHSNHDKLTGSIMDGLKTITQDAVQMAQGIEKLNPPPPKASPVVEPIEQPAEEVESPHEPTQANEEIVAEQQPEKPTSSQKDQIDEVKVMKADTDEDGTFMLEEQDQAEPHIAHVIAQVMSMVESGDAFDQLGRQLQILDAGDALMIPLGDEFGQTQLVLLDKQSDSANTLLARVQMHQLQ